MAVIGALVIAWSSILVRLAEVSPSTAAIFRCAYALPLLGALAWREDRRLGRGRDAGRLLAAGAGVFFAADLIFWHHAIGDVGAGLATVLGNLQVAFVPLVAWAVLSERPGGRVLATLPLVLGGVVLISGVLGAGRLRRQPHAGGHLRRGDRPGLRRLHPAAARRRGRPAAARRGRCSTRPRWRPSRASSPG